MSEDALRRMLENERSRTIVRFRCRCRPPRMHDLPVEEADYIARCGDCHMAYIVHGTLAFLGPDDMHDHRLISSIPERLV
jgi:hypothetical protein